MRFSWVFSTLTCDEGGIVVSVQWRRRAERGRFSAESCGEVSLSAPVGTPKPFADLDEADVEAWVVERMSTLLGGVDADLWAQVEEQRQPKRIQRQAPWRDRQRVR